MKVLIACEYSGRVRDAFIKQGHDAMSCDILPTDSPGPHYQGDVFDIINNGWDMMIAHPPCTYLTCTANRSFVNSPDRWRKRHSPQHERTRCPKERSETYLGIADAMADQWGAGGSMAPAVPAKKPEQRKLFEETT